MQIDFYQLSRDPVERVAALLSQKAMDAGAKVLIVSGDTAQRRAISQALWEQQHTFLAHGDAGTDHAERQPVLLSDACAAPNGASMILMADGRWREEAGAFDRAFLLFGEDRTQDARALWSSLSGGEHALRIFKQREDGAWREGR